MRDLKNITPSKTAPKWAKDLIDSGKLSPESEHYKLSKRCRAVYSPATDNSPQLVAIKASQNRITYGHLQKATHLFNGSQMIATFVDPSQAKEVRMMDVTPFLHPDEGINKVIKENETLRAIVAALSADNDLELDAEIVDSYRDRVNLNIDYTKDGKVKVINNDP